MKRMRAPSKAPLIVIDVQDSFIDDLKLEKDKYASKVARLVSKAREQGRHIFLVQYRGEGSTTKKVRAAAKGYSKATVVWKSRNDGGIPIHNKLTKMFSAKVDTLLVCGVNLDYCVLETVSQLVINKGYKCRVLRDYTRNVYNQFESGDIYPGEGWVQRVASELDSPLLQKNMRTLARLPAK